MVLARIRHGLLWCALGSVGCDGAPDGANFTDPVVVPVDEVVDEQPSEAPARTDRSSAPASARPTDREPVAARGTHPAGSPEGVDPASARKPPPEGGGQARQPPKPGQPAQPGQPPKPPGIHQVSSTKWTVTRTLANHWMKSPYALGNVREAGKGWQLMGVRNKAGYWLGMRNGDIIMEANGHKLDTKPQLMSAYLDLKNDSLFRVTFVRNGQTMVHVYQIVEGGGGGGGGAKK